MQKYIAYYTSKELFLKKINGDISQEEAEKFCRNEKNAQKMIYV